MKKEEIKIVKQKIDEITGENYTKTFSSKTETLHVRIGSFQEGRQNELKDYIEGKEQERKTIIKKLTTIFPQYKIEENNKRYQGFINDICITIR